VRLVSFGTAKTSCNWLANRYLASKAVSDMARIAVIVEHARKATYCEALGAAYVEGARNNGHHAELFATANMLFDPVLHEGFSRIQPLEPDLQKAHYAILAADHLVFIFPLWMGCMPTIFKGFMERVLQPDVAGHFQKGEAAKLLRGKSARVVVTMGMPAFVYRWYYGAHALRLFKRNILSFVGAAPVRTRVIGSIETVGADKRGGWIEQMRMWGK
jgi:NAD(P)H dehydrogenase (quinone)